MSKGLAAELDGLERNDGGQPLKVDRLYGDQLDVLDSIRRAHQREIPLRAIAKTLGVSSTAVKNWLERQESE